MQIVDSSFTPSTRSRRTLLNADLGFIRQDTRFKNQWGSKSGKGEWGGVRKGSVVVSLLAFATCRQERLTAAGKDKPWYSINAPGERAVHVDGSTIVLDRESGKSYTMDEFWALVSV
jgi:hypothetical protein